MPYLIKQTDDSNAEIIEIKAPTFTIGRLKECNCVLKHAGVSRMHAVLRRDGFRAFLLDRTSRNGTYINNARVVSEQELFDGDVIQICNIYLTYRESTPAEAKVAAASQKDAAEALSIPSTLDYDKRAKEEH